MSSSAWHIASTSNDFAAKMEEKSAKFYLAAAKIAKNLMAEAARIMEKLGKESLANKTKLEAL